MAKKKKKKKKNGKASNDGSETVPFGTKLQYVAVGAVLGVAAGPTVRKWLEKARPEIDKLLERITAHAEELAENAGDWMSVARGRVSGSDGGKDPPDHSGHTH